VGSIKNKQGYDSVYLLKRVIKKMFFRKIGEASEIDISILNVFIIETELQYLAFLAIKMKFDNSAQMLVFSTSTRVYERIINDGYECDYINKDFSGWLGRYIGLRKNLSLYKTRIEMKGLNFTEINLHLPRIDSSNNNLAINFLKNNFSSATVNVRLIPDGAINIFSEELSTKKLKNQKKWRDKYRLSSSLNFYTYSGDELGADAEIVDRIYSFRGVELSYPKEKIILIDFPVKKVDAEANINRVLVVGQNFLQLGTVTKEVVGDISQTINEIVKSIPSNITYFAPHPRSVFDEFNSDDYILVKDSYLCVEEYIAKAGFTHIISCYSSVLINSKIMFGDKINVYSVGIKSIPFLSESQSDKLTHVYRDLGIEVVDL
jgi:hypothetical protein